LDFGTPTFIFKMKLKPGDKVIWKQFIGNAGQVIPYDKITDDDYKRVIKNKEVLTIKKISNDKYYITKKGFEQEGFYEGEFELHKVTNWKKEMEAKK